ncbi:hypothetical protein IAE23_25475 [Bacillus sp. S35]|nr:hypothetical protein [Bacillus sp. S35]
MQIKYVVWKKEYMIKIEEGNRHLTSDISKELHKELRFLALENRTNIMK